MPPWPAAAGQFGGHPRRSGLAQQPHQLWTIRAGGDLDVARSAVAAILQALIELEAAHAGVPPTPNSGSAGNWDFLADRSAATGVGGLSEQRSRQTG